MTEKRPAYNFESLYSGLGVGRVNRMYNDDYQDFINGWSGIGAYRERFENEAEVMEVINSNNLAQKATLSRVFFRLGGFYWRILNHYATMMQYTGVLIPHAKGSNELKSKGAKNRYKAALNFIEDSELKSTLAKIVLKVLIDGSYYGMLSDNEEAERLEIIDLPYFYCRSNLKDLHGNYVVELNVEYFESVKDAKRRKIALRTFSKEIQTYYATYLQNKGMLSPWVRLPVEKAFCFRFHEGTPQFLHVIPDSIKYDAAVARNAVREIEEIKKIIVQKIPITSQGELVFEPDEAAEMHNGAVEMLRDSNPNTTVMTTYADTESIVSKVNADPASTNGLEKMKNNLYTSAGTSTQLFAPTANQGIVVSLQNDLALMMTLINDISSWLSRVLNYKFEKNNINFTYNILPITWYNATEYLNNTHKIATSGYSLLIPALAAGLSQKDLIDIKELENDVLKLQEILIPLQSSYTLSGKQTNTKDEDAGGRPPLDDIEKTDKTKQNEISAEKRGGADEEE